MYKLFGLFLLASMFVSGCTGTLELEIVGTTTPSSGMLANTDAPESVTEIPTRKADFCQADTSEKLIADAWLALADGDYVNAIFCSQQVIDQYTAEAIVQQRQLGLDYPTHPEEYAALNDVATAWLIKAEALYASAPASKWRDILDAYEVAQSDYPSAQALYSLNDGSGEKYWSVRQRAFCQSYQLFPDPKDPLPTVYTDKGHFTDCYLPSGYMPPKESYETKIDLTWSENCYDGKTCIQVVYPALISEWEGVFFQYPENNWGEKPGLDLSQATALIFWARGEQGGEKVKFAIGGTLEGKPYDNSLENSTEVLTLDDQWRKYVFDLEEFDRSSVIGAFAWFIAKSNNSNGATFYLDDVVFVGEGTD